ncbi:helix-turn-helix domain-containing protein [Streptomyces sp. NPDC055059]|uniref:Helix-turn-helix domain-containing protein n=1 Tax=Streptomyces sp. NBC_00119 TaxID=2975659 RepID=A0AAU1U7Z9_9ACTN|nr:MULTISPECIES: helix-turn-helix domain-containing protein [unclassified Streptomyces]MCX4643670.1 helix-turn-helix domain-containing protein [Streptomyces sp. NBC_01446]MCX5324780.1 helix-turn-helix domain-containing protein [Streptomyces sp. NBC_00120]
MTQSSASPLPTPKERRRLRESKSLTLAQVAAKVGVTCETVRAWESGRSTPRGHKRDTYAKLLASVGAEGQAPAATAAATATATPVRSRRSVGRWDSAPLDRGQERGGGWVRAAAEAGESTGPAAFPKDATDAFDRLYAYAAPGLVRQAYLLTGRRTLARESVERAFQLAWQRWPEVAVDRDPAGWVRAAAYEYAMSPWHRLRPSHRHPEAPPADADDRALLDVLLSMPSSYRRTLLLYDGVGLDLPETAAETEATTPAAAQRLLHAREAVAEQLPALAVPDQLHRRLTELAGAEKLQAPKSTLVRTDGERRTRFWTRSAIAVTVLIIGATALTLHTAPTRYEPVPAPGAMISGVPPRTGPGPLTRADKKLRDKLHKAAESGPHRLAPEVD